MKKAIKKVKPVAKKKKTMPKGMMKMMMGAKK